MAFSSLGLVFTPPQRGTGRAQRSIRCFRPKVVKLAAGIDRLVRSLIIASPHSGVEAVAMTSIPTLTHHGIVFVPIGYKYGGKHITNTQEMHGGSPWGAHTLAEMDGSRQPSELELELAEFPREQFYKVVKNSG